MGYQTAEGRVFWLQDLNASTTTTAYPTLATQGIAKESLAQAPAPSRVGNRLFVAVDYADTVGATSCNIQVYGYADTGAFSTSPRWLWVGAMNKGAPIAATGAGGAQVSATRVMSTEAILISGDNFSRFCTRSLVPAGTAPTVSTFIGFALE